ncbi:MAG: hypothetical protein FWG68_04090, partial [Defluviitaleaceae bacterium]|nr:hypothetical protein [Defluviitaleaceae bacterium]
SPVRLIPNGSKSVRRWGDRPPINKSFKLMTVILSASLALRADNIRPYVIRQIKIKLLYPPTAGGLS